MTLRPYQEKAIERVEAEFSKGTRSTLIVLATGCHARGERVLAADGRSVAVESVRVGDSLLGADGTPRRVLALHHGAKPCYRVEPIKGKPFVVTEDHMLTLVRTAKSSSPAYPSQRGGSLVDVTVKDWLGWSANKKHLHKLVRASALDFKAVKQKFLPIPPYVLGVLLGDGCFKNSSIDFTTMDREVYEEMSAYASANGWTLRPVPAGLATTWVFQFGTLGCKGSPLHNALKKLGLRYLGSGDKFIPHEYLTASIHNRLELLAGLIDSDGCTNGGSCDYTTKSERLANDIAFLCRSLGMSAYPTKCRKGIKSSGFVGEYYRLSVNGNTDAIPCRVARRKLTPRKQKKNVTRTGFGVVPIGKLEYFGFTVDGDNRYLLDDFTITHNCGKTIVFSNLAAREVRRGGRVLILAHRGELLDQAIDKLYKATGIRAGLEKAEQTSDVTLDEMPYTVVVGSVQSMKSERRLARFKPNEFSLIVIDECHHALTGTYRAVIDHFPQARLLGVTATPDRGDLRSLSEVFQTISFEYSIIEAIKDGYLSPIHAQTIPLRIDLRGVAKQAGDYQAAGLGAALAPYLHQICREIKQRCADRKTIVFTPLISISREMLAIFKEEGISEVREVNGDSADRAKTLEWFASAPKGCVLLNSMLLTEGYDEPSVDCIVVLRATKVRSLWTQMVGRGTRLSPETGKKNLLLLDFLWLTATHDLCRPACLLSEDPNVCEEITRKTEKKTGADEDLEISPELVAEVESEFTKKCKDTLAKRLEAQSHKKGKLFDALQYAALTGATDLANVPTTLQEDDRPTLEQVDRLEKLGFACPGSKAGAEKLLNAYQQRVDDGLSTHKQIKFLTSRGFQDVKYWTLRDAEKMIRRIAAVGWNRLPAGVDPATYVP